MVLDGLRLATGTLTVIPSGPIPEIDRPLAIKLAGLFVQLGLTHSKQGYMSPEVVQDEKFNSLMGV